MCTVTFVPQSDSSFVLTSNRDEAPNRNTLPPRVYVVDGVQVLFPKDELAGGTWIGASDRKRIICLMNGGFQSHERKASYRMSRGVIVTDLLSSEDAAAAIASYDFSDIEPFTIVMVDWSEGVRLFEMVWDGTDAHLTEKPIGPHIWSSSLLYSSEIKRKRELWFSEFLKKQKQPSEKELLQFHKNAGEGNSEIDLIMDRSFVKTKSISQFLKNDTDICFRYEDLQSQQITMESL